MKKLFSLSLFVLFFSGLTHAQITYYSATMEYCYYNSSTYSWENCQQEELNTVLIFDLDANTIEVFTESSETKFFITDWHYTEETNSLDYEVYDGETFNSYQIKVMLDFSTIDVIPYDFENEMFARFYYHDAQ